MSGRQSALKPHWREILFAALLIAFAIPLCRRSIVLADEGYILLQSLDMLNGKVLYRDMDAFVTPGIWIVLAATFKLLGPSVIASRVPALVALLILYATSYRITLRLAGPRYAIATLVLMAACTVWAFPGWTFAFYSPFSITFAVLALARLLAFRETTRNRDLFLCGIYLGTSIMFKQNYGVFALIGIGIGLVGVAIERRSEGAESRSFVATLLTYAWPSAAGVAALWLPLVAYLALEGALAGAWQSLVVHPFEFSGKHDIPYLAPTALFAPDLMKSGAEMLTYAAQPIYRVPPPSGWIREVGIIERLHVLFYWLPPILLPLGVALSYRPASASEDSIDPPRVIDAGMFSVVAFAGMLFLGVFPRADFNHLTNVYQPIVIAGVIVAHHVLSRSSRPTNSTFRLLSRTAVGLGAVLLTLVIATAAFWYHGLIKYLATPVRVDRAGVLARPEQALRIAYQVDSIRQETSENEAVLTLPDLSMLNFLADRPMPSAYYNLYEHHIAHDAGESVTVGAEEHDVQLAITRYNNFFSDRVGLRDYAPKLTSYLSTHFAMQHYVGNEDFIVFRRRAEPISEPNGVDFLPYCDTTAGYQETRYHLLFPALYHNPGTGHNVPAAAVETRCSLDVPVGGATLQFRVGYRAPARVVKNTTLRAEIVVLAPPGSDEPNRLLFQKKFYVKGQGPDVLKKPLFGQYEVDLSRYAGQHLELLLRTERYGKVMLRPLEHRGFGTSWEEPVLLLHNRLPEAHADAEIDAQEG